jgi:DinB superfamily
MNPLAISPPEPNEYAPYYGRYISLISEQNILATLEAQAQETTALLSAHREPDGDLRYAPGKWSVKEVCGHLGDTERIFAYRALRIARADRTPLAGFEQDDYVRNGPFGGCHLADLVDDLARVRQATLSLFRSLDQAAWRGRGVASNHEVSVRAIAYIIAGHELHHRRILEERYFAPI